jgi:hypothetical protein
MNERCFYMSSIGVGPALDDPELIETLTTVWLRSIYRSDRPPSS